VTGTGKATRFPLRRGDVVEFDKWGGGGYGDPLERESARVLQDFEEGVISREAAEHVYGVVVRDGAVDAAATEQRRRQLANDRIIVSVVAHDRDAIDGGTRLWEISPALAGPLECANGAVLECVRPGRTPLRGRARIDAALSANEIRVGPRGRGVLGAQPGDRVWLRVVPGALYPPQSSSVSGHGASV